MRSGAVVCSVTGSVDAKELQGRQWDHTGCAQLEMATNCTQGQGTGVVELPHFQPSEIIHGIFFFF